MERVCVGFSHLGCWGEWKVPAVCQSAPQPSLLPQTLGSPTGFEDGLRLRLEGNFALVSFFNVRWCCFVGWFQEPVNQVLQCVKPREALSRPYLQT